jgi:SAM-dependent methyltransferase
MLRCQTCHSINSEEIERCPICGRTTQVINGFKAWAPEAAQYGEHYDPAIFSEIAKYEANNFWFRARNALITALLFRYAPRMSTLLEIGCGTGFVLQGIQKSFPDVHLVGSELFIEGLQFAAQRNPSAELVQMDARTLPYVESFDVVAAFDVLEHIGADEEVIAGVFEALRPGGIFFASVPQHPLLWSAADDTAHHVRRYTRNELQDKISAAGFEIVRSTSFVSLLLPAMALSRLRRNPAIARDPLAEFRIPRSLNAIFEAILAAERKGILLGVDFPIGGSRFVVARRPVNCML